GLYDGAMDLELTSSTLLFTEGEATAEIGGVNLQGATFSVEGASVEVVGNAVMLPKVQLTSGELLLPDGALVEEFVGTGGAKLLLAGGGDFAFTSDFSVDATAQEPFQLASDSEVAASFQINSFSKVCLDFVEVTNVNNSGEAIVSLGENGSDSGAESGWQFKACEDVLFPEYEVLFPCEKGLTVFLNSSSGSPESYQWDFGDGTTSTEATPKHSYAEIGNYEVSLTIRNGDEEVTFLNTIEIELNGVEVPQVVASGASSLASLANASTYQWFVDGDSIAGATERSYNHQDVSGDYQVLITNDTCSAISDPFSVRVSSIPETLKGLEIYPNPANQQVTIQLPNTAANATARLISMQGQVIIEETLSLGESNLRVDQLPRGMYLLRISVPEGQLIRRLLIE
ncbi:MAG: PKD domain-containing protein, partial [Bacteroidota bacterium]